MGQTRKEFDYDLISVGSGAGGSVAAHIAAQNGKKVAVVELDRVGGECPNFGCVPTKALLQAGEAYQTAKNSDQFGIKVKGLDYDYEKVAQWKDVAVKRTGTADGEVAFTAEGITLIKGRAHFISPHEISVGHRRYSARNFIIATGTHDAFPPIEGLEDVGFMTYKDAIALKKPPQKLFVIGGGPIGCEFTQHFANFGCDVHIAEFAPHLIPREDEEVGMLVGALFEQQGIKPLTGCQVYKVTKDKKKKVVHFKQGGASHQVTVDEILVATGKHPNTDLGLENAGVEYDKRGVKANAKMQTTAKHIYAAGDVTGPFAFTHMASYQSRIAIHNILHKTKVVAKYHAVPRCVFTEPEVATVGMTENEAKEKKIKYNVSAVPVSVIGRSNTSNQDTGFVKVIATKGGVIIGAAIVSPRAGEMIHELALAVNLGLTVQDIESTIHAFPTWSEAVRVACAKLA